MATDDDVTGPMNLGNPQEIPVSELATRVIQLTGSVSRIVHRPLPQDDPVQRCPDITMAKQHLSWEPRIDLDVGLGQTIAYFSQLMTEQ
jgi:UDP-glucuronate decarboxylase